MPAKSAIPRIVMITGGTGLLGKPIAARFAREHVRVAALGHADCDVTRAAQVAACIEQHRPELIIHCAAYTKVDDCESHPNEAMRVNAYGAANVARIAQRKGIRLMHISSDYVFDGGLRRAYRESDPPGPADRLCIYGRTKLAAEQVVQFEHPGALIVRSAWLFGADGPCFPRSILKQAQSAGAPPLRVVNDQTGSPTFAADLADALLRLAHMEARGILHVVNSGSCTWHDLACEVLRAARIDIPIKAVTSAEFERPARRPAWSVLSNEKYAGLVGQPMRSWQDAVREYVELG